MGKRYFCDYCQRSFIDDIDSRKKHLNGVGHLRMKKEYYVVNRDLKTLIKEERAKQVCRRFRNTGDCQFGLSCNHTHYSEEELLSFEQKVRENELSTSLPNVDDWLKKRLDRSKSSILNLDDTTLGISGGNDVYTQNVYDTSPSLRPATLDEMKSMCSTTFEWG